MLINKLKAFLKLDTLNELYSIYFKVFRHLGVFPFAFVTNPNSSLVEVTTNISPRLKFFSKFTLFYVICVGISKSSLLIYHNLTEFKYETMKNGYLITSLWLTGAIIVFTIIATVLHQKKYIAEILTSSLRLEENVFESKFLYCLLFLCMLYII